MAERRMFSKKITTSDAFLEMPDSAQNLYFHLSMDADDDGFVGSPKSIMRLVRAKEDDMKLLITKSFIIPFDRGIIVIKHWRINNLIRSDRYKPTTYTEERAMLAVKENGAYTEKTDRETVGIPSDTQWYPQDRLGEVRLGKVRRESAEARAHAREADGVIGFEPPTLDEVKAFVEGRQLEHVDAERFYNWFSAAGWYRGKTRIVNWQAEALNWERGGIEDAKRQTAPTRGRDKPSSSKNFDERTYTDEQLKSVMTSIDDLEDDDL